HTRFSRDWSSDVCSSDLTNRYTKVPYTEDPSIMSWQVGNEPRAFSDEGKAPFARWLKESVALIRSLDSNHLVSIGSEGSWGCEMDMQLFEDIHADEHVDYLTMHIWPKNWSWIDSEHIPETMNVAIENTNEYIAAHIAVANKLNKP